MKNFAICSRLIRIVLFVCVILMIVGCTSDPISFLDLSNLPQHSQQSESPISTEIEIQSDAGGFSWPGPYPSTLEGFLQYADLIVMATLGEMENSLVYGFDDETAELIVPSQDEFKRELGISMAAFDLEIEEIFWASDKARIEDPVILRVIWSDDWDGEGLKRWEESLDSAGIRKYATGDRYLFILAMAPDGTYGAPFDENRLVVDDDGILHYSQMAIPYPVPTGEFREGERYGGEKGPALTVADLVLVAEEMAGD